MGPILIRKLSGMGSRDLILPDGSGDAKGGVREQGGNEGRSVEGKFVWADFHVTWFSIKL